MPALTQDPITADGDYDFATIPGSEIHLDMQGDFGAATFTLAYFKQNAWFTSGDTWTSAGGTDQSAFLFCPGTAMRLIVSGTAATSVFTSVTPVLR